jgi:biopolymer transport protein TolQ
MFFNIFKSTAWQLIAGSDGICLFILLVLFLLSVFCIAIMAFKYIVFRRHKKQLALLTQKIKSVRTFNDIIPISKEFKDTLGGRFLLLSLSELKSIFDAAKRKNLNPEAHPGDETPSYLSAKDFEQLEIVLDDIVIDMLLEEESYLPVLSTSASASPLIGLFGTIWGLIRSFVDISQDKSTEIATVAPGLAESLITTLAGLVVAIPALVAFHYFAHQMKKIERSLMMYQEKFLVLVRQSFVK